MPNSESHAIALFSNPNAGPDLAPKAVLMSSSMQQGATVGLSVQIRNIGNQTSSPTNVVFVMAKDPNNVSSTGIEIGSANVPAINGNSSWTSPNV
jgi:subtilase family serine protease